MKKILVSVMLIIVFAYQSGCTMNLKKLSDNIAEKTAEITGCKLCQGLYDALKKEHIQCLTYFLGKAIQKNYKKLIRCELLAAIGKDNVHAVSIFVQQCPEIINTRTNRGNTPLHFIVKNKQNALIALFLDNKANPHILNKKHVSAFDEAINAEDLDIIKVFLDHKIDINNIDEHGTRPLDMAISKKNSLDVLKMLFDAGAHCSDGCSYLHSAIIWNHTKLIDYLLSPELPWDKSIHYFWLKKAKVFLTCLCILQKKLPHKLPKPLQKIICMLITPFERANQKDDLGYTPSHYTKDQKLVQQLKLDETN